MTPSNPRVFLAFAHLLRPPFDRRRFRDALDEDDDSEEEEEVEEKETEESGSGGDPDVNGGGKDEKTATAATKRSSAVGSSSVRTASAKAPRLSYETLVSHGYSSAPSVRHLPPPDDAEAAGDWRWGQGSRATALPHESREEREATRHAATEGAAEAVADAQRRREAAEALRREEAEEFALRKRERERKEKSWRVKEKRKREQGKQGGGKNYVEEEKRLARDHGIYSGFDT